MSFMEPDASLDLGLSSWLALVPSLAAHPTLPEGKDGPFSLGPQQLAQGLVHVDTQYKFMGWYVAQSCICFLGLVCHTKQRTEGRNQLMDFLWFHLCVAPVESWGVPEGS